MERFDLDPEPHAQFDRWFTEATDAGVQWPEQMALATATPEAVPSVRMVLLKGHDPRGFVFYTSRTSRKGAELDANPRAAAVLHWKPVERQIRLEGTVEMLTDDESFSYFRTRPRDSKIGAWASPQSQVIADRASLEQRASELESSFGGVEEIPLPPFWGGYRIVATAIEFWQGRPGRLHDRFRYLLRDESWVCERLAP